VLFAVGMRVQEHKPLNIAKTTICQRATSWLGIPSKGVNNKMRKIRFMAFSGRKKCKHMHMTAKAASKCALQHKRKQGGTWLITSAVS